MAIAQQLKDRYIPKENTFYCNHYHHVIIGMMVLMLIMIGVVCILLYQMFNRPLPIFNAQDPTGKKIELVSFEQPNLLPDTILRWAKKAATVSYTFDFIHYNAQAQQARPFFTELGWTDYVASVGELINTIIQNRLILNSVVSGTPVISNQGPIPGQDYAWRVQIPFLVSYQSSAGPIVRSYLVSLTIVRVPTSTNPQGIGIDQFVMVRR